MGRTIFVGDVHACGRELGELLERVAWEPGDQVCLVGDLVSRGPEPRTVMEHIRRTSARSVRGNHEEGGLAYRAEVKARDGREGGPRKGERSYARALAELSEEDWAFLESLPLFLDWPEHEVRVVHAGV